MKLLFCDHCGDLFVPKYQEMTFCFCKNVQGLYQDAKSVVHNGKGIVVAISNYDLLRMSAELKKNNNTSSAQIYSLTTDDKNVSILSDE